MLDSATNTATNLGKADAPNKRATPRADVNRMAQDEHSFYVFSKQLPSSAECFFNHIHSSCV